MKSEKYKFKKTFRYTEVKKRLKNGTIVECTRLQLKAYLKTLKISFNVYGYLNIMYLSLAELHTFLILLNVFCILTYVLQ